MRLFNSCQIVALFAGAPYFISWLSVATFPGQTAAFWGSLGGYVFLCWFMVALVYSGIKEF